MSRSGQAPRNGLAKLLWEADADAAPSEIAAEKETYECPACGWRAELQRTECMVCESGVELSPVGDFDGGTP